MYLLITKILIISSLILSVQSSIPLFSERGCKTCECKCQTLCESGKLDELLKKEERETKEEEEEEEVEKRQNFNSNSPSSCKECAMENLEFVNRYRAQFGLPELIWNDRFTVMAVRHSYEMFRRKSLYHSNYPVWENVAYSSGLVDWYGIADAFFEQWRKSPGHNKNMLVSTHRCAGIGIFGDGVTFYGTQIFSNDC